MSQQFVSSIVLASAKFAILCVLVLTAQLAFAASLSLSPATGVYTSGQTFTVRVVVNTTGASINAADGTIKFNPNELSVVSVTKGSVFNLWTAEPTFSNSAGTISFSGGTPTGYKGSSGAVLNITFRTKGAATSKVNFTSGSVLAADGMGTNVLTNMAGGTYTVSATTEVPEPEVIIEYVPPANTPGTPVITSATHPDSTAWYAGKNAELSWTLPAGVTAVRTALDRSPSSIPSKVYDTPISRISLNDLEEGVQYFHLQFRNADGWGKVAHYRLAVDSVAPRDISVSLAPEADLSNPTQVVSVTATEETSGLAKFKVQLDGAEPIEYSNETGSSTFTLSNLTPGYHSLIVEALDAAGNSVIGTLSFTILSFDKPIFTEYPAEINEEVIPVIKGQTRPGAAVAVTVAQLGLTTSVAEAQKTYTVTADADGIFTVIPDGTFGLGVYELVAVATDQYGAQSEPSDPIRIAVQKPGYLQIGSLVVSILSVFIPLLALTAISILGIWYALFALRRTRRKVGKEAEEALTILTKEFNALEAGLTRHKEALEASRKAKKLTKAEEEVLTALARSLKEAKERVRKEISDVEDVVD